VGVRRLPNTESELIEWGAYRDERGRWVYPRELRDAIQAQVDTPAKKDGGGVDPVAWVKAVLRAWNAVSVGLHMAGINIYDPAVRALPWGALMARVEHVYLTDRLVRAMVDKAKEAP
jgi:hypothetical protein